MLRLPFLDFFAVLRLLTFLFSWTQTPRGRRGGDKTTSVRARARLVPEQDERGQSKGGEAPISKEVSEPHLSLPTVFAEKPGRETRGHLPLGLLRGRSRRRRFLRAPLGHTESEGAQPSRDQPRGTVTRPQWKRWSPRVCVTSIPSSPHLAVRCNAQSRARSAGRKISGPAGSSPIWGSAVPRVTVSRCSRSLNRCQQVASGSFWFLLLDCRAIL